jgi:hypothetical protein
LLGLNRFFSGLAHRPYFGDLALSVDEGEHRGAAVSLPRKEWVVSAGQTNNTLEPGELASDPRESRSRSSLFLTIRDRDVQAAQLAVYLHKAHRYALGRYPRQKLDRALVGVGIERIEGQRRRARRLGGSILIRHPRLTPTRQREPRATLPVWRRPGLEVNMLRAPLS